MLFIQELRQAIGEVHGLLQERDRNLEAECERLRLDNESRLEESMAAFNNAETDDVKRLKQELEREKNKGKTLEDRNEALLKVRWKISAVNKYNCLNGTVRCLARTSAKVTGFILLV